MNRVERRAAAREGILAAAHRQVAEGGCASASVAVVAARAGVAAGSLYRHFPSRAALLAEVVRTALQGEHALALRATVGRTPPQALAAWTAVLVERTLQAPGLARALWLEPAGPAVDEVRAEVQQATELALATLLEEGVAAGAWPPGDARRRAAAITGALRGVLIGSTAAARLGPRPDVQDETTALVDLVADLVGAPRSRRTGAFGSLAGDVAEPDAEQRDG